MHKICIILEGDERQFVYIIYSGKKTIKSDCFYGTQ